MKLAVVCSENNLEMLPKLRHVFDSLFIESLAWYPRNDLEKSMDTLERCLDYSPYILCIADRESLSSKWLYYAIGHQRGRTDRLTFWVSAEDADAVPEFANRYVIIVGDEKDVYDYYSEVEESWCEETKAIMARRELTERNIENSSRSFVESVQEGDRFLMGLFLEAGFSPSLRDGAGVPVMSHAIRSGHIDLVEILLDAGADLNGVAEDRGTTPVMDAAAGGHDLLTRRFIELGADLEHVSRDGQTAVILAVGNGRDGAAIELIRGGADVEKKDMLGMSARKYATLYGQSNILQALEEITPG